MYIVSLQLTGTDAQSLAMSVLDVTSKVLRGSSNAKARFECSVGYGRLLEALKSLGQPSQELLKHVFNLVSICINEFGCKHDLNINIGI